MTDPQKTMLSNEEMARYSRHLLLPEVGASGQAKLKNAKILVAGAGGLGAPALLYLAAAGVGTIGIAEFDSVDVSNLQRQVLYSSDQVGTPKIRAAAERLKALNPLITIHEFDKALDAHNALAAIADYDIILDGTDNFSTRYLLNDACVLSGKAYVYGAIYRFDGQVSVFGKDGPCYRCLFPEVPPPDAVPNCAEGGVLGVMAGIIGTLQASEALKLVLGVGKPLLGRLLVFDALHGTFAELRIAKNKDCPICGDKPTIRELRAENFVCSTGTVDGAVESMKPNDLKQYLDAGKRIVLLDVRTPEEYSICKLKDSQLIPLNTLQDRVNELNTKDEIVVYCKSGVRSRKAASLLKSQGFQNVRNLEGGILAWARDIDPAMPTY